MAATVDLYDASVPVLLRYLGQLRGLVDAADAFAAARRDGAAALLEARLAPDMMSFERQVAVAAQFALRAAMPLAGQAVPPFGDAGGGSDALRARIDSAAAQLRALDRSRFDEAASGVIEERAGDALVALPAAVFLLQYALPNFFFHLGMAYAILRHAGAAVGKRDFDGWHVYPR